MSCCLFKQSKCLSALQNNYNLKSSPRLEPMGKKIKIKRLKDFTFPWIFISVYIKEMIIVVQIIKATL